MAEREPDKLRTMGARESELTVREGCLAMLIGYLEARDGVGIHRDSKVWQLANEVLDLFDELNRSPRYLILSLAQDFRCDPEGSKTVHYLGQKLDLLKAELQQKLGSIHDRR